MFAWRFRPQTLSWEKTSAVFARLLELVSGLLPRASEHLGLTDLDPEAPAASNLVQKCVLRRIIRVALIWATVSSSGPLRQHLG